MRKSHMLYLAANAIMTIGAAFAVWRPEIADVVRVRVAAEAVAAVGAFNIGLYVWSARKP